MYPRKAPSHLIPLMSRDLAVGQSTNALGGAQLAAALSQLDEAEAWRMLRGLALRAHVGSPVTQACGLLLVGNGHVDEVPIGHGCLDVFPGEMPGYRTETPLRPEVALLLDLYLPLCIGRESAELVVAHLGQSLDGQIATANGAACFITGPEDMLHTHRLRALCDAVVVGCATVVSDNPRLTTRLVDGDCPIRVVIDPEMRTPLERNVFFDGASPTLVLCAQGRAGEQRRRGLAEIEEIETDGSMLPVSAVLDRLRKHGLRRIFIEGGGITVSRFLQAGAIHRLHLTVSPLFLGRGRPSFSLPEIDGRDQAMRADVRRFALGTDTLFDCQLRR
jgi:diaminohydroxyphosphoribosylaminopyrimidine deaminase / 5-amino-6-(5-phosphoribosylamino)uracil reductase